METRNLRKEKIGIVISDKMNKSIVVTVERRVKHPKYGKFVKKTSTFMAHDEANDSHIGDKVRIADFLLQQLPKGIRGVFQRTGGVFGFAVFPQAGHHLLVCKGLCPVQQQKGKKFQRLVEVGTRFYNGFPLKLY